MTVRTRLASPEALLAPMPPPPAHVTRARRISAQHEVKSALSAEITESIVPLLTQGQGNGAVQERIL